MSENDNNLKEPLNKNFREPKIRFPEFKDSWEPCKIADAFKYEQPTKYIVGGENYLNSGVPVLTAGKTFILGYTDETKGIKCATTENPVIIFDDFTTESKLVDFDFKIKSSAIKLLTAKGNNDIYFLFNQLQKINYIVQDHQRHWIGIFQNFEICLPSEVEQNKISNVLQKTAKLSSLLDKKLVTLKKYKEGLLQSGIKLLKEGNNMIPFKDLFVPFDQRNISKLSQYTVGINGLSPLEDFRYDISNHKVFTNNCLILGIGIEEIGVSENLQGSISPVYDVYKIDNPHYTKFMKYFLKPLLYEKRRFITRKSTRREFEIDSKELLKTKIEMPTNDNFLIYVSALETIDNLIKDLDVKCEKLKSIKGFLLNNLFV